MKSCTQLKRSIPTTALSALSIMIGVMEALKNDPTGFNRIDPAKSKGYTVSSKNEKFKI